MADTYIKIDNDTFERTGVLETVKLSSLKSQLAELETQRDMAEPTDAELIEFGKITHPYYESKTQIIDKIKLLDNKIKELKLL